LTVAVPHFTKLQKEGDSGRKKLNQFTRVLTILITAAQSYGYIRATGQQWMPIYMALFPKQRSKPC